MASFPNNMTPPQDDNYNKIIDISNCLHDENTLIILKEYFQKFDDIDDIKLIVNRVNIVKYSTKSI